MGGLTNLEWKGCELDMMLDAQWDWPWVMVHGKLISHAMGLCETLAVSNLLANEWLFVHWSRGWGVLSFSERLVKPSDASHLVDNLISRTLIKFSLEFLFQIPHALLMSMERSLLTHLPLDKMAAILQTLFPNAFSSMKSLVFCILIKIALKFVPNVPIDNNPALV